MSRVPPAPRARLLVLLFAVSGCWLAAMGSTAQHAEAAATPDDPTEAKRPRQQPAPPRTSDPVEATHYLFIGRPAQYQALDCAIFESPEAPHRRPPERLNDATDFPERLQVLIELIEALRSPAGVPASEPQIVDRLGGRPRRMMVAFALGTEAFRASDVKVDATAYDAAYCGRLNAVLGSNFVVIHAYPVYNDRGNSLPDLWRDTWGSLGTDPGKANAGFETLAAARAYAATLAPRTPKTGQ